MGIGEVTRDRKSVAMQFKSETSIRLEPCRTQFFAFRLSRPVGCVAMLEVNNLIALHAAVLVGLGKYGTGLYRAYSIWFL